MREKEGKETRTMIGGIINNRRHKHKDFDQGIWPNYFDVNLGPMIFTD